MARIESQPVIHSDPEIMGGTPVFVGTRVPLKNLIDYLEGGHSIDEFLDDFPSVERAQALAVLEQARELLIQHASAALTNASPERTMERSCAGQRERSTYC